MASRWWIATAFNMTTSWTARGQSSRRPGVRFTTRRASTLRRIRQFQTPNSDTPYSWLGLDLRTEPYVLTVPEVEKGRYYSIQFTDAYTFNIDYAGSRATGNGAASFLVVGPGWKGETPKGIKKVVRSETYILMPIYRVQLFEPNDIDNVKKVQAGFKVQTLSSFLGTSAPTPRLRLISSSRSPKKHRRLPWSSSTF